MDTSLLRRNLAVLGKIKVGDKLLVQGGMSFDIAHASSRQPLIRWAYGENRTMNCESLRFVLGSSMVTLSLCDTSDPYELVAERVSVRDGLLKDLRLAMEGLENLKETYRDDIRMSIQFDGLKEMIRCFLDRRAAALGGGMVGGGGGGALVFRNSNGGSSPSVQSEGGDRQPTPFSLERESGEGREEGENERREREEREGEE